MSISPQHKFLDELLAGHRPDVQRLQSFLAEHVGGDRRRRVDEDLHLEFKSGDFASVRSTAAGEHIDPGSELRRYVAGFANAEGGVLIIGVAEARDQGDARALEPVKRWATGRGAENGERWISDCLVALRPFLSPPPRVYVFEGGDGTVAVVAVPRSHALVACEEGGRLLHYFRLHDKTIAVPAYLVQDLVLGRRQQPVVGLDLVVSTQDRVVRTCEWKLSLNLSFRLFNRGLPWLQSPVVGLVILDFAGHANPLQDELRKQIDVGTLPPDSHLRYFSHSVFGMAHQGQLEAFGSYEARYPIPIVLSSFQPITFRWRTAAVVLSLGASPSWFQIEACIATGTDRTPRFSVTPVYGERPKVSLEVQDG